MAQSTRTETVRAAPSAVFAVLDDVTRAPEWLSRCTKLENLSGGPTAVGTRLRYHYQDGRRTGVMEGSVVAREQDRKLTNHFTDRITDVTADFELAPDDMGGTTVTHTTTVRLKGIGKLLTPMINRQLPRQTESAVTGLKRLVEGAA